MKIKIITMLLIFNVCMLLVCVPMSWAQAIRYVKANSTGANNGSSWSDAYISLQSALAAAQSTDQIWVAAGTYKPTSGNDRSISFVMKNGVALYGGFDGTETQLSERNWRTNATILSGNIGDTGVDTDNTYRVINNNFTSDSPLGNTAILDGFIVEKGYANADFPLNLGGGMWNTHASPTVQNCLFRNNFALAGAGMFNDNSQAAISNCLFVGNACSSSGAGIANGGGCDLVKITNCTFYGNTGFNTINNQSNAAFANCIIWGNGGSGVGGHVTYSIVQGGYAGTGNLNVDPLFANPANGDFRLQQCSPAIDAGTATDAPATDFVGNTRVDAIVGAGVVDMGAYEYQSTYDFCTLCANINGGIIYVNASASGSNNGNSWANAFTDLQSALSFARSNPTCVSQIWVAAGTYKPTTGTDRSISFSMLNGVAIYGGFSGTESQLSERNWATNVTTLSGDIGTVGNNDDNSNRVIINNGLNSTALLDGFTIRDGYSQPDRDARGAGGMYNFNASPTISNCIFRNNYSFHSGGAVSSHESSPVFTNCIFTQNATNFNGGAVFTEVGNPSFINCTFVGNSTRTVGSNFASTTTTLLNCVVWDNTPNGINIYNNQGAKTNVTYSIVQGGYPGTGNLDTDPLFVNPAGGDFRLQSCSPAINVGDSNLNNITRDLDNKPRLVETIDLGAYEYQSPYTVCQACISITTGIVYVNASATGSNNGSSWANAFTDLQSALSLARTYPLCVSQIWVAKGTYRPTSGTDRKISFSMVEGVAIYGGFDGTESQLSERNWTLNQTILSGDIGTLGNNSDNSYRVVNNTDNGLTSKALLDGVTITAGYATNTNGYYEGAGMLNQNSSPSLKNINFVDNQAIIGGGMYNIYSSPSLTNVTFSGNSATSSGGGMCVFGSNSVLTNVAFVSNQAPDGGGININLASPTLTNVVFLGNRASRGGGVFLANNSRPVLTNMTFSGNQATNGGSICNFESSPVLKNCILWGNGGEIANFRITNPTYTYCLIQGMNPAGTGNLDGTLPSNDPLFVTQPPIGLGVGDLRLQSCSPVLNVGTDADNTLAMDIVGNNRKVGVIDFGAYEYQGSAVTKPTASASTSTADVCVGNRINLSAGGGGVFSWTGPNNFSSTDQNPNFIGSSVSYSGTYTVRVSNDNCASTATATVSVQVRANPTAIATSNSPVCEGGVMRLSVTGGTFYNWTGPNGYTSAQQNPTRSGADIAMSGVYSVTLSSGSCTATASTLLQIRTLPLITASSNTPLCAGSTLNLSASGGTTYTWSGPGGYNSQQRNPTRSNTTTAMSGGYSIVGSDGTCTNTASTFVLVSPNVVPSITSLRVNGQLPNARGIVTVPTGQAINFSITASNALTYSWQSSTGFSSTLQNPSISNATIANQGQYIVVARNNCQFFAARSVSVRIGSASTRLTNAEDAEGIEIEINAYPNPVSNSLTVEVRLKEAHPLQLKLLNSAGQTSGTWQLSEASTVHRTELNLSDLTGGIYLLEAQAGQQRAVKRVVKVE